MKNLISILLITFALNSIAGTGGISGFLGFGNGGIDAGTGGVVGGVDDLDELRHKDWKTIREHVKKDYKLDLQGDIAFVGKIVSVFDVCINNDKIQTIKKLPIYEREYLRHGRDNDIWKNKVVGYKHYAFPIESHREEKRCYGRRDSNCRLVNTVRRQSLNPKITLRKDISRRNKDNPEYKEIFTKKYDIPYCK